MDVTAYRFGYGKPQEYLDLFAKRTFIEKQTIFKSSLPCDFL